MGLWDRFEKWLARGRATVKVVRRVLAEEIDKEAARLRYGSMGERGTILTDVSQAAREAREVAEYVRGTQHAHDLRFLSEVLLGWYKAGRFPPLTKGACAVLAKPSSDTFNATKKFEDVVDALRRDLSGPDEDESHDASEEQ